MVNEPARTYNRFDVACVKTSQAVVLVHPSGNLAVWYALDELES
jgi:hypothetical protein